MGTPDGVYHYLPSRRCRSTPPSTAPPVDAYLILKIASLDLGSDSGLGVNAGGVSGLDCMVGFRDNQSSKKPLWGVFWVLGGVLGSELILVVVLIVGASERLLDGFAGILG